MRPFPQNTVPEKLCLNCPGEFLQYFAHCSSLPFKEQPDYCHLKKLFRDLFVREGYEDDSVFDWDLPLKPRADGSLGLEGLRYLGEGEGGEEGLLPEGAAGMVRHMMI